MTCNCNRDDDFLEYNKKHVKKGSAAGGQFADADGSAGDGSGGDGGGGYDDDAEGKFTGGGDSGYFAGRDPDLETPDDIKKNDDGSFSKKDNKPSKRTDDDIENDLNDVYDRLYDDGLNLDDSSLDAGQEHIDSFRNGDTSKDELTKQLKKLASKEFYLKETRGYQQRATVGDLKKSIAEIYRLFIR